MGKETCNDLIPVISATNLRDRFMTRIDLDVAVICTGSVGILGSPVDIDTNPAIVFVPTGLSSRNILKMTCQDTGGKELPVRDLTAVFIEKLLTRLWLTLAIGIFPSLYQDTLLRFGAKIGSRIVFFSASLSSSSVVALLMIVLGAER